MEPIGDGVQKPLGRWQVVLVGGLDLFPPVGSGVGCRKTEHLGQRGFPVAAVVGKSLARPLAGDQDPPSGVAEVGAAVGLALAGAGDQAGSGFLGLDAVAEPVGAGR
jgi:hypothetical protein